MKNMGKKIRYIAFFIGVCVLLAGCGKKFDASGYTKAVLDVSYKNEIQKYVELTGADEKEADKIFEDNLQNNMDIMLQEFSGYELPDELEEKYRKLFSDMMKQVKYTVAEAKEVENKNFTAEEISNYAVDAYLPILYVISYSNLAASSILRSNSACISSRKSCGLHPS